ncbi:MAG TPA: hypothetical protein VF158_14505 [Longimicrobiales bacterium]
MTLETYTIPGRTIRALTPPVRVHASGPRPERTYPAELVFLQRPTRYEADGSRVETWHGRLLRPGVWDYAASRFPVEVRAEGPIAAICERTTSGGRVYVIAAMQGGPLGGRRYFAAESVTEAQERLIAWAGRRFRVPAP